MTWSPLYRTTRWVSNLAARLIGATTGWLALVTLLLGAGLFLETMLAHYRAEAEGPKTGLVWTLAVAGVGVAAAAFCLAAWWSTVFPRERLVVVGPTSEVRPVIWYIATGMWVTCLVMAALPTRYSDQTPIPLAYFGPMWDGHIPCFTWWAVTAWAFNRLPDEVRGEPLVRRVFRRVTSLRRTPATAGVR